ncbi:MAG: leucine-rich repeat domain-containing protein, partial [Duncaniella sp.]|nr:leucine-rich repeat domain-containing protein [Duncaniella sp.]
MEKRIKRYLLLLALALVSATGYAYDFQSGDLCYTIVDGGVEVARLDEGKKTLRQVEVPATVTWEGETYDVIGIGASAFAVNNYLSTIKFPDGLKYIADGAFRRCTSLHDPVLPDMVESVGERAFSACSSLHSFTFGSGIKYIGDNVFGEEYWHIEGSHEFADAGTNISDIYSYSFTPSLVKGHPTVVNNHVMIKYTVHVPAGCEWRYRNVGWEYCYGGTVDVKDDLPAPTSYDGMPCVRESKAYYALDKETKTAKVLMGSPGQGAATVLGSITHEGETYTVTAIGDCAYEDFSDLESISVPSTLTRIGERAFYRAESLKSFDFGEMLTSIGGRAFVHTSLESVTLPESLKEMGSEVFDGCENLKNVVWNASLTEIPSWTFAFAGIESFKFPNNIAAIGSYAFYWSNFSGDIALPESVRIVGESAFKKTNITSMIFKGDIESVDKEAFRECPELAKVRFEGRTGDFGKDAFLDCPKLATVEIADLNSWATSEFANAAANPISVSRSLTVNGEPLTHLELYLPDENVGSYAFAGLKGLKLARVTGKGLNPYA